MPTRPILMTIICLIALQILAQSVPEINKDAIDSILYTYTDDDAPGMAVGIVKDGAISYENYLGLANLEHQINIGKDTRFNIASNAKQFTAICILKLAAAGKLSLSDDIRKYLPDLYPNIESPITISTLINHTSGIRDYCDLMALKGKSWWTQFIDNGDAMELLGTQTDLNFIPATDYLYSNSNYIVLTEIVKAVTGDDFSTYAKHMFEALGMSSTAFQTHYAEVIPNRARPYGNWGVWRDEPTITEVHGDGALYTTLSDQLQWERIVQTNEGNYLSKNLIRKSQLPIENAFTSDCGYGLMFGNNNGLDYAYHDGVTSAYNATFLRFPSKKLSIVVMGNNRNIIANNVAWEIANQVLGIDNTSGPYPGHPATIEPLNDIQSVLGNYQNEVGTIIKITEKEGAIFREMYQRDPVKLLKKEGALFEYETIEGLKMNFIHIGKANQQFTLYLSTQAPNTFYKLPSTDLDSFNKEALNGRYYNAETDTEIILKFVEDDTYALIKNGRERDAKLILTDYLKMNTYEIKILRDRDNKVTGLNVNNNRIQNVLFDKT